jgi:hypothetical protein
MLGDPITAMSIQYVTASRQKPRRIDDVAEERLSPQPPLKSNSHADLTSLVPPEFRPSTTSAEPKKSRGSRSPTQKTMLSKALAKANSAVLLDNSSKIDGAIEAYAEACELLQQVMVRSSDMEDRKKLSAIRKTYSNRIAELHDLDDSFASLMNKDLPDDPPSDDLNRAFYGESADASTVDALEQVHIPPRGESLLPQLFGGEHYIEDATRSTAKEKKPKAKMTLELPMESRYVPPPLSPRRLPEPQNTEPSSTAPYQQSQPEQASQPRQIRRTSTESTSWLDTIDDGDSIHSSSYKSRLSRLSRLSAMGLELTNNSLANEIEAEFDAALNAAVDAAYDSADLVDADETPKLSQNLQRFGNLPKQDLSQQSKAPVGRARADSEAGALGDYLDEDTTEEEERLLDEVTQGYVFDDFRFDHKSKSALPRQSDSSNFSGRTHSSSNQSTTLTAATNLSTLAEGMEPLKEQSSDDQVSSMEAGSLQKSMPLQTLSPQKGDRLSLSLRDRRLSGQNALKIETYAPTRGTMQVPSKNPPKIETTSILNTQKPLPLPGPPSTSTAPITPLASIHSNDSQTSESPATPALTQVISRNSADETTIPPPSPSRAAKAMPPPSTSMRKNVSSTSLRQRNMSISGPTDDQSPLTPGSAIGPGPTMFGDRKVNVPPLPTPTTSTFTHQASFSGGMHLFDDHIGTATSPRTPRSPGEASQADPPVPLEPCPESFLLRPWWLMRCLYQVCAHPRGGHLTNKLFLSRDIWRVKNVKLRFLEDKISQCDILTAALLGLAKVDNFDADAMLVAVQSFETELDKVRAILQKKLGNEVGVSNSTNVFKSPTDEGDAMAAKTPNTSAAKSFASGWRKLRSKSSTPAMPMTSSAASKDPALAASLTMPSLPMTNSSSVKTSSRGNSHRHKIPPPTPSSLVNIPVMHAQYMSSLARLFDAVQILDAIARQVEDPGMKANNPTYIGLDLSVRNAAEFFAFFIIRFVMADINTLVDKFLKRGAEWVMA